MDANLVKIETKEENEELYNEALRLNVTDRALWIGLSDVTVEGKWVWTDNETVQFTNWSHGQSDNAGWGEDCAALYTFDDDGWVQLSKWNDRPCWEANQATICERKM